MAQLDLPPMDQDSSIIDSAMLAGECIRVREQSHYREHLDLRSVLASFFLHVYHAKVNKRHSALIFIQEAISCARLLRLDCDEIMSDISSDVVDNEDILFLLLWVSERGYAMHLGLSPSYADIVKLPDANNISDNVHVQGLLELARLFVAFAQCFSSNSSSPFTDTLVTTEDFLHGLSMQRDQAAFVRLADYHITKEWMRTIIWQQALSLGLLSSTSYNALMTFTFPSYVGRDLLSSLKDYHSEDLLPLGRDQLLKCFEVANSLADTLLCNPTVSADSCFRLGPQEFLHGLYQKLAPFLEQDPILNSILRQKTAEALLRAPSRLWTLDVESAYEDVMDDEQHGSGKYRPVNLTSHTPAY
ncbi:hypothetical protein Plec18167_002998 [Paecilomyces lecythidis]|uniref:Uncharacterized protein n=1 Tax=Paecilomyces lecythidis TaxID=3004212 RepID=A0ABR3Y3V6_9EURO